MRLMEHFTAAATVACLLLAGAAAQASDARELFRQGKEHYRQGQYEQAIADFEAAGRLRPSPILDYNIARCHENLGNTSKALDHYERYLASEPPAETRARVEQRVATLRRALALDQPAAPGGSAAPDAPAAPAPSGESVGPGPGSPGARPPRHEADAVTPAGARGPAPAPPVHEATLAPRARKDRPGSAGQRRAPAAGPKAPGRRPHRRGPYSAPGAPDTGPFYKQWWFWVGCAAAAAIVGFVAYTAATRPDSAAESQPRHPAGLGANGGLQLTF